MWENEPFVLLVKVLSINSAPGFTGRLRACDRCEAEIGYRSGYDRIDRIGRGRIAGMG